MSDVQTPVANVLSMDDPQEIADLYARVWHRGGRLGI